MRYRRRTKRDANHAPIVRALEAAGRSVVDLSAVGGGCPDLIVGWSKKTTFLEVKNPEGRDTVEPSQVEFARKWKGCPIVVVRSAEEALVATDARLN